MACYLRKTRLAFIVILNNSSPLSNDLRNTCPTMSLSASAIGATRLNATPGIASAADQYSNIIKATSELQADLTAALATVKSLREENDGLAEANARLRSDVQRATALANEAREAAIESQSQRVAADRVVEARVAQWRAQLEIKEKQIAELAERLKPPRDLELLRVQIREEINGQNAGRLQAMSHEAEQARAEMASEVAALQTKLANTRSTAARDASTAEQEHAAVIDELQRSIASLQAQLDTSLSSQAQVTRDLRMAAEDAIGKAQALATEVEAVRNDRDAAQIKLQQAQNNHDRDVSEMQTRLRTADAQSAAAIRRATTAEAELTTTKSRLSQVSERVSSLAVQLQAAQAEMAAKERALNEEQQLLASQLSASTSRWDSERRQLVSDLEVCRQRSSTAELHLSSTRSQLAELEAQAARRVSELQQTLESSQQATREAKCRVGELTAELAAIRSAIVTSGSRVGPWSRASGAATRAPSTIDFAGEASGVPGTAPSSPLKESALGLDGTGQLPFAPSSTRSAPAAGGRPPIAIVHMLAASRSSPAVAATTEDLEDDVQAAKADLARSQGDVQAMRRCILDLRTQVASLQAQVRSGLSALADARRERSAAEEHAAEAQARVAVLEQQSHDLQCDVREAELHNARSLERIQSERAASASVLQATRAELEHAVVLESDARRSAVASAQQARSTADAAWRKAATYKSKLLDLFNLYKVAKQQLEEAVAAKDLAMAARDADVARAMRHVNELMRERDRLLTSTSRSTYASAAIVHAQQRPLASAVAE